MKQIFDWIMEQMHEYSEEMHDWDNESFKVVEFDNVENIINEAEAKWEKDCCIRVVGKPFTSSCGQKWDKWTDVGEPYCSKCGKPIKISEVE